MTALQPADTDGEWQGFWGEDDGYYVCRTRAETGVAEWYHLVELESELGAVGGDPAQDVAANTGSDDRGPRPARMRAQLVLGGRASTRSRALIVRRRRSR